MSFDVWVFGLWLCFLPCWCAFVCSVMFSFCFPCVLLFPLCFLVCCCGLPFGFGSGLACSFASCFAGVSSVPLCVPPLFPFVCFPCASLCAPVCFLLGLAKVWLVSLLPALLVCPLCSFVFPFVSFVVFSLCFLVCSCVLPFGFGHCLACVLAACLAGVPFCAFVCSPLFPLCCFSFSLCFLVCSCVFPFWFCLALTVGWLGSGWGLARLLLGFCWGLAWGGGWGLVLVSLPFLVPNHDRAPPQPKTLAVSPRQDTNYRRGGGQLNVF